MPASTRWNDPVPCWLLCGAVNRALTEENRILRLELVVFEDKRPPEREPDGPLRPCSGRAEGQCRDLRRGPCPR